MPSPKKTPMPRAIPPSKTSHLFGSRKSGERSASITSERIESDLKAFRKSGGKIEVLGVTRSLTRIDADGPTPAPATTAPKTRR